MRADDWSIVSPSARGRDSMRISSPTAYDNVIIVLDVEHMPTGCGTWPAFWTLSDAGPWPNGGEIDIIEGQDIPRVSYFSPSPLEPARNTNARRWDSLQVFMRISITRRLYIPAQIARCPPSRGANHSVGRSCFPSDLNFNNNTKFCDRNVTRMDCDAAVEHNAGCGVMFSDSDSSTPYSSLGLPFNFGRGGYYVTEKGPNGVKIWFFLRSQYDNIPPAIRDGVPRGVPIEPNPSESWGDPDAYFPFEPELCDYATHFNAHRIVFDLTFCVSVLSTLLVILG